MGRGAREGSRLFPKRCCSDHMLQWQLRPCPPKLSEVSTTGRLDLVFPNYQRFVRRVERLVLLVVAFPEDQLLHGKPRAATRPCCQRVDPKRPLNPYHAFKDSAMKSAQLSLDIVGPYAKLQVWIQGQDPRIQASHFLFEVTIHCLSRDSGKGRGRGGSG